MAYCYWAGLDLVSMSRSGMIEGGNSQYSDQSPSAVSALGKSVAKCYSSSSVSFKRILRMDQFTRDSRQK